MGRCPHRLDGVGVEEHPRLPADPADLGDGLDGADLVVGVHHAHQAGVRPDGRPHLFRRDDAVLVNVQQRDGEALLLEAAQRVQHGVVLKGRGDDVLLTLGGAQVSHAPQGLVVRLAAPRGEDQLPGLTTQPGGDPPAGIGQGFRRLLAGGVKTACIAVALPVAGEHGLYGRRADGRGGGVICVDSHDIHPFAQGTPGRPYSLLVLYALYYALFSYLSSRFLNLCFVRSP